MEKSKSVRAVPEGFRTVTPYLVVDDAVRFMDFVEKALGGRITFIQKQPDEKVMHATVSIGDSTIMVCDAMEGHPAQAAILYVYVDDADKLFNQAVREGATVLYQMENQFYGDRVGAIKDNWNIVWWIGTHVEDVDPDELKRRAEIVQKEREAKKQEVHA